MKICFLIQQYNNGGGTEMALSSVANGLVKRGYDIMILSIGKGKSPRFHTSEKIKLCELDMGNNGRKSRIKELKTIFQVRKAMLEVLKIEKPKVIVAVDIVLYHYVDYLCKRINAYGIGWEHYCLESRKGALISYSRDLSVKNGAYTVVISDRDLLAYKNRYPKSRSIVRIYDPVFMEEEPTVNVDNKRVIAAGRLTEQKGFDLLIEAWSKIYDRVMDWELYIYGEGEDREKLQGMIDSYGLDNVFLAGYSENLGKEMDKASIFVLSSRYEGFGLVLAEAMAKGIPAISFDCPSGPSEIISHDKNGFLVPPLDVNRLGERILKLTESRQLRRLFSENARQNLYKFNIESVISEWEKLLYSI
ncbi:MAG: glycosyltransferase family 4 protein [Clostridia bacterium]|nr:glycosyltransferase family 4 protein [Clostridia bacterium]